MTCADDPAPPPSPVGEPVAWTEAGPVSPRFGDVYFSAVDGLEESRAVFLRGCGLPERWAGRRRFTVAELGFGTGLNILALLGLWAKARPSPQARLSIWSVEGFPLAPHDAEAALRRWPELGALASPLLARWPRGRRGLHRYAWPELNATLDLQVGDVERALAGWAGRADAWFLDGFAPARNPAMWTDAVLAAVAARSAPGARLATFTVAGAVRRGLAAGGLAVDKRPGFGRKRERLEAVAPGGAAADPPAPSVAVIGEGIAGASLVRALGRQGCEVVVVARGAPGAAASRNAAALVTPRLDAGGGPVGRLHAEAFAHAAALYRQEALRAVLAEGALQLERAAKDAARFAAVASSDLFVAGSATPLAPAEAAPVLGEPGAAGALRLADALVIEPAGVLDAWLGRVDRRVAQVVRLEPSPEGWRLIDAAGAHVATADAVVIAAGAGASPLAPELALRPVRGQASTARTPFTGAPAAWGGYAIPTRQGVLFGASHVPGDTGVDVRPQEAAGNLARLREGRPGLAERVAALPRDAVSERAAVRVALRDHSPVAGPLAAPGLYILGGLGARGFTLAPLLAEHVAALIAGAPSPLSLDLQAVVSPGRRAAQEPAGQGPVPAPPAPAGASPGSS